jgi:hypothetical protein
LMTKSNLEYTLEGCVLKVVLRVCLEATLNISVAQADLVD